MIKEKKKVNLNNLYREIADIYEEKGKIFLKFEEKYLKQFLPSLKSKKVLDVGCGTGRWDKFFLLKGANVIGIDKSKEMLKKAKKIKGLKVEIMDAKNLKFKDNNFDLTFSSLLLSNLKDYKKVVKEMIRVTKHGGWIIISNLHGALGTGKPRLMEFEGKKDILLVKSYPIYPSNIIEIGLKNRCKIEGIKEVSGTEYQKEVGCKISHQPLLLMLKMIKL